VDALQLKVLVNGDGPKKARYGQVLVVYDHILGCLYIQTNWRGGGKGYDYSLNIPKHWVVVRTFSEDGILKQEEINAVDFYLQSKDTNYAKSLRKQDKQDD